MRKATKWEARMLAEAALWASNSKDPSTQVGAVIYDPDRYTVVTTGYNGFPRGVSDSLELYTDKSRKYPRIVHAELNAIVDAAYQGKSTANKHLAITHHPCSDCAGAIIQAGIKHIIYKASNDRMERHNSEEASILFEEARIRVEELFIKEI